MTLRLEDKKAIVEEVAGVAGKSLSAIAADYRGLTVSEMTDLRAKARAAGVYLRVVRNTLARRALSDTDFACMHEVLTGPLFLAFSQDEPGAAARILRDFAKVHESLEVKALSIGGKLLAAKDIDALANLPSRDQAISMLMSVMQAPIGKLVRTLAEPYAMLARTMGAVRDQKQAS